VNKYMLGGMKYMLGGMKWLLNRHLKIGHLVKKS